MAKRAKNEAKRNAPKKEVKKAMNAAEKYADVLVKLKAGELVEGFTLLPKAKARINHTVDHLFDLDDGTALCKYKDV
jgi:SUMO ligase MMS21 Smc5/6 complex component